MQYEIEEPPILKRGVWKVWPTIGLSVAIFAIFSFSQIVVSIIFAIIDITSNPHIDIYQYLNYLTTNGFVISIAYIISAIVGTGFIILFIKIHKGPSIIEYLGLNKISKKMLFILLAVLIGLLVISLGFNMIFQDSQDTQFTIESYRSSRYPVLFWITVIVFAPIFEETFFRGFLFAGLRQSHLRSAGAIILTTVVWSLSHLQYNIYGMASIFILGIVLG
ncbi:MAG: CPBP family intramembrane metalloprotease, partial [Chloroflexi bacterium]|nr:CPBP family intramembrane metalloprotease [Chloroflexota bacterium]